MRYKNSSTYVQRQINRLLRVYRRFARIYIDNIVIFFRTLKKHIVHLRAVFKKLVAFNIFIKFSKIFIDYFSIQLLKQKIDFFEFFISEKKLQTIAKLQFSRIFRQLKIYLSFID